MVESPRGNACSHRGAGKCRTDHGATSAELVLDGRFGSGAKIELADWGSANGGSDLSNLLYTKT